MTFPYVACVTTGLLLILQVVLAASVSIGRGKHRSAIGDGGKDEMLRLIRRHGNLAENAGIFACGLILLDLSNRHPTLLLGLCTTLIAVRVAHAIGLSRADTDNAFRVTGAVGTYLTGLTLAGTLVWTGARLAMGG